MNESELKKAGILIRERRIVKKGNWARQYQVVDGRRVISRHVMFADALKSAQSLLTQEVNVAAENKF